MAEAKQITLKRFNGTDYDPLYPKTTGQQVFNSALNTPLLDSNDKIDESFLPNSVFGGMKFVGVIAGNVNASTIYTTLKAATSDNQEVGAYFIASSNATITFDVDSTNGVTHTTTTNYGGTGAAEEGDSTSPVTIEKGDWFVLINKWSFSGTDYVSWSYVNNTYALATTTADGIMSSSDKTKLDGIAASANNYTHPSYDTRSVDTTGVDVLDTFTSDSTGHVTGIGTRTLPNATTSAAGVMSASDKTKLDGIATSANNYSLPLAASGTRGGIQLGATQTELNRAVVLDGDEDAYVALPRQIPAVTLNNSASTSPSFYAPTNGGLDASTTQRRQFLEANGTGAAPTWTDAPRMLYEDTESAATSTGVFLGDILFEF